MTFLAFLVPPFFFCTRMDLDLDAILKEVESEIDNIQKEEMMFGIKKIEVMKIWKLQRNTNTIWEVSSRSQSLIQQQSKRNNFQNDRINKIERTSRLFLSSEKIFSIKSLRN